VALFLSTYTNKLDKKGRISVPSQFRTALVGESFAGVILYPSFVHECAEACGISRIEQISTSIDRMDTYSSERDAFAVSILGGCIQLAFDGEGRISLPENLIKLAGIKENAVFVGKGQTFEIWNPDKFNDYIEKARKLAKDNRGMLSIQNKVAI
jgi:MraZ protein